MLTWFAVLCAAAAVEGATLIDEPFAYPNGTLVTVSGGAWTTHSGTTGQVTVASGRAALDETLTEDVHTLLAGQPYSPTGPTNTFYAGFVVRFTALPSSAGTYFAHFKDAGTGFRARIWAFTGGAAPGKFRLGISSVSGSTIAATNPVDLSLNRDYLVVTRLVNSNSTCTLWIDPASEADPGVSTSDPASGFTVVSYALRESGGEGSLSIDDLRVGSMFSDAVSNRPPILAITSAPQNQATFEGASVTFGVAAAGAKPLAYHWQFEGTNLPGATSPMLVLSNVTWTQAGVYRAIVTNESGSISSDPVTLSLWRDATPAFSLLTYNAHGNGIENWSTNSWHVQAIGRQLQFLQPDIITLQEIPDTNTWEMTNFVTAFLPEYFLATNSTSDDYIRSVIISRFPILESTSRLHGAVLAAYGYTNSAFTRDLFEAAIAVPGFPRPLRVFTAHLKSGQDADTSAKRSAEAAAVSNYFAVDYAANHYPDPCVLTGDMNEDILRPPASDPRSIQRLIGPSTRLQLSTPFNSTDRSERTFSIQAAGGPTRRYDYVLPCELLYSNVVSSQVFRTDYLTNPPAPLRTNDDTTASDHLPVMVTFANPYAMPFRITSIVRHVGTVRLRWESVLGQTYGIERSADATTWAPWVSGLTAFDSATEFATNLADWAQFFRVRSQ